MYKIRPNIWISGADKAANIGWIQEEGITSILNVAHDVTDPDYDIHNYRQVKIALGDHESNRAYMKELAVQALKLMILNNENVLVHCAAGASRSVWVVCKALGDLEGVDPKHILEEVQSKRPEALYGPLFG